MKKFFVLSMAILSCGTLGASGIENDISNYPKGKITIHVVNQSIGEVENGSFLQTQDFIKRQHEDCDFREGLFKTLNEKDSKVYFSLKEMEPSLYVSFGGNKYEELVCKPLKRPGSKDYQKIEWYKGDHNLKEMSITPRLIVNKFAVTTQCIETLEFIGKTNLIEEGLKLWPTLNNNLTDITIDFFWSRNWQDKTHRPSAVEVKAYEGTPIFEGGKEVILVKNWENKIGLRADIKNEHYSPSCYTPGDLNFSSLKREDLMYVVRNSLKHSTWINLPKCVHEFKLISKY